jgi:hypothetical protein
MKYLRKAGVKFLIADWSSKCFLAGKIESLCIGTNCKIKVDIGSEIFIYDDPDTNPYGWINIFKQGHIPVLRIGGGSINEQHASKDF